MSERLRVVFTGGGTGGHLYPAIAIAEAIGKDADVTFIGTADRLESTIVPKAGYPLVTVRSRPLVRKPSLGLLTTMVVNATGVWESLRALHRLRPDIVIATGGYVCFPVVLAARLLRAFGLSRTSIALLEPNARPGLTNRLLAPLVDEVWGAFPHADPRLAGKYVATGIPVRASLAVLPSREAALERLGLSCKRRTLLALGGSQGARSINDALISLLVANGLPKGWQLIQVTGEKEYDRVRAALRPGFASESSELLEEGYRESALRAYLDDMADAYAAADLVLARAGASTLGELAALGKPAILIPYPHAAEDHQRANAAAVAEMGAAVVVEDRELAAGKLRSILAEVTRPARLETLRAAAQRGQSERAVTTILARVDTLRMRKKRA